MDEHSTPAARQSGWDILLKWVPVATLVFLVVIYVRSILPALERQAELDKAEGKAAQLAAQVARADKDLAAAEAALAGVAEQLADREAALRQVDRQVGTNRIILAAVRAEIPTQREKSKALQEQRDILARGNRLMKEEQAAVSEDLAQARAALDRLQAQKQHMETALGECRTVMTFAYASVFINEILPDAVLLAQAGRLKTQAFLLERIAARETQVADQGGAAPDPQQAEALGELKKLASGMIAESEQSVEPLMQLPYVILVHEQDRRDRKMREALKGLKPGASAPMP